MHDKYNITNAVVLKGGLNEWRDRHLPTVKDASLATASNGRNLYMTHCGSCHGNMGAGLMHDFPPLAGDRLVAYPHADAAAFVVLAGLKGRKINGIAYSGTMPAFKDKLKDDEIAAILSYARSHWGNQASKVEPRTVTLMRRGT